MSDSTSSASLYSNRVQLALQSREAQGADFLWRLAAERSGLVSRTISCFLHGSARLCHRLLRGANGRFVHSVGSRPTRDVCLRTHRSPTMGIRAEAIEYFALLDALEASHADRLFDDRTWTQAYGPWSCMSGVLANRQERQQVLVRAVEASRFFFDLDLQRTTTPMGCFRHLEFTRTRIHAAVGLHRGVAFFPVVTNAGDNGGQMTELQS